MSGDAQQRARLRGLLAEGWCLCQDANTDWQAIADLLDAADELERIVAAVESVADRWAKRADDADQAWQWDYAESARQAAHEFRAILAATDTADRGAR